MFQGDIRPTGGVLRSQFQEIVQLLPFSLQVLQSGYKAMFWKPHPSSTGNPAKFVTPVGCPNGEGIALGESKGANGAMAADGGQSQWIKTTENLSYVWASNYGSQ